jgi:methionyl aminopeptidase
MISGEDIERAIEAGRIASNALMVARGMARKDARLIDVARKTEEYIIAQGALPAFPMQISINDVAAHDAVSFDDERVLQGDETAKLDVGVHVDGIIADNALTVDLGGKNWSVCKASLTALSSVEKSIRSGIAISELSSAISESIEAFGARPVSNLSGHGLGKYRIHSEPQIPNVPFTGSQKIMPGMHAAIEPFATNGFGKVTDMKEVEVFALTRHGNVRDSIGRAALSHIKQYNGLPFSMRWLCEKMGKQRAEYAVNILIANNIITPYPKLREIQGGIVAQHERTFIITDSETIITTRWSIDE